MQAEIIASSKILKGKSVLTAKHYRDSVSEANSSDLVYMDPPYQGVSQQRDSRYLEGISIADFIETLDELNAKKVSYIVSYDGRTGDKVIGKRLPSFLELDHIEINAGRSSQATLLGRSDITYESIYLSPVLKERLSSQKKERAAEEIIHQIERYMLLSGSTNRAKSWSCEHCRNWIEYKSEDICGTCYWAYPEKYTHVAMEPVRRVDIIWSDQETAIFDQARADAEQSALNIQDYIKRLVRKHIEGKNTE